MHSWYLYGTTRLQTVCYLQCKQMILSSDRNTVYSQLWTGISSHQQQHVLLTISVPIQWLNIKQHIRTTTEWLNNTNNSLCYTSKYAVHTHKVENLTFICSAVWSISAWQVEWRHGYTVESAPLQYNRMQPFRLTSTCHHNQRKHSLNLHSIVKKNHTQKATSLCRLIISIWVEIFTSFTAQSNTGIKLWNSVCSISCSYKSYIILTSTLCTTTSKNSISIAKTKRCQLFLYITFFLKFQ